MRSHSPSQQQQCVLGEDRCCLHHHLQPSYRCQPDQTFVVEFYHSKAEGDDRIRSGQGRGGIFYYLSPGVPKLEKNWLQKSVPDVEQNRDNYAGNTHHSESNPVNI